MNFKPFKIGILIGLSWGFFSGGIAVYAAAGDEESEIGREVVALYLGAAPLINDKKNPRIREHPWSAYRELCS